MEDLGLLISFFLATFFVFVNGVRMYYKDSIPFINFAVMTAAITAFIYFKGWLF